MLALVSLSIVVAHDTSRISETVIGAGGIPGNGLKEAGSERLLNTTHESDFEAIRADGTLSNGPRETDSAEKLVTPPIVDLPRLGVEPDRENYHIGESLGISMANSRDEETRFDTQPYGLHFEKLIDEKEGDCIRRRQLFLLSFAYRYIDWNGHRVLQSPPDICYGRGLQFGNIPSFLNWENI